MHTRFKLTFTSMAVRHGAELEMLKRGLQVLFIRWSLILKTKDTIGGEVLYVSLSVNSYL